MQHNIYVRLSRQFPGYFPNSIRVIVNIKHEIKTCHDRIVLLLTVITLQRDLRVVSEAPLLCPVSGGRQTVSLLTVKEGMLGRHHPQTQVTLSTPAWVRG